MGKEIREILEITDAKEHQLDESKKKLILKKITFPFAVGDKENLNQRTYPSEILRREVEKMNKRIQDSKVAGTLEHPPDGMTKLGDVSHFIEGVRWDEESKRAYGTASILNTSKGSDVLTLLQAGLKMGVSMRGFGDIKDGKIQDNYELESVDIVTSGAFGKDVEISNVNLHESLNSRIQKEEEQKDKIENMKASFQEARLAGYKGTYQDWKTKYLKEG